MGKSSMMPPAPSALSIAQSKYDSALSDKKVLEAMQAAVPWEEDVRISDDDYYKILKAGIDEMAEDIPPSAPRNSRRRHSASSSYDLEALAIVSMLGGLL